MLPSTGMKSSTSASRSQPSSNTKHNRILRTTSSNMKNKVEDHPRSVKFKSNKMNRAIEHVCNAHVKHTMLNANSELIFVKCNQCVFDANHDVCFLEFVNDVNVRSKSKSVKKSKNKNIWKPTDNGTEFVNQTLRAYYEDVGISHQTSVSRSPQHNGVVKKQNQTLVECARTMLIFSKALQFLWAEAVVTVCFTQNRSLIQKHHNKIAYELLHNKKPDLSYFHVFGALCYLTNDSENLGKLKPKADIEIFVGYAPAKKAF
ncbi:retrovirus-related pol polyprotein from transposon TNT 1-94 [Tanacetum coccineum]